MPNDVVRLHRFRLALAPETAEQSGATNSEVGWVEGAKAAVAIASTPHPVPAQDAGDCLSRIYAGLRSLPPADRAVLILWALERLSAEEIAAIVDRPAGLVVGQAAELAAKLYRSAMTGGTGCDILIAEDERITALELKEALEEAGHNVPWVAASAGQAISLASMHRPVLAIIDIRLKGGTDGVSAAREIQETLDIAVILTTAYTDQTARAESIEPYGFLPKPWSDEDLMRALHAALTRLAIERLTPGLRNLPTS